MVSTHSHPKVAAHAKRMDLLPNSSFNTQPPEGGCCSCGGNACVSRCFNTQPPEGGCMTRLLRLTLTSCFNTQPPEGGCAISHRFFFGFCCFNTQPPEGGCKGHVAFYGKNGIVSTHSHPKVAAKALSVSDGKARVFQHTATRRWLQSLTLTLFSVEGFQHTATRRWLLNSFFVISPQIAVSTHSHPKVAAITYISDLTWNHSFNTQPPEGGCSLHKKARKISKLNTVFR